MRIVIHSQKYGKKYVFIDQEDYELIKDYTWRVNFVRGNFYAITTICQTGKKPKTIKMHRLIMEVLDTPEIHIDHKNDNGLNNRKGNLRKATIAQNSSHVGLTKKNTSGYKGIYQYKKGGSAGLYTAALRCNGIKYFGGYFNTAIEAAKKYDELAKLHHGEFAHLNFP